MAARHAISAAEVNNYRMDAKRRFREILAELVAETVDGPEQLREEMQALFGKERR